MLLNITLRGRYVLPVIAVMILSISKAKAENELTLDQAYKLVLSQNPMVQSYQARYIGAEGNRIQQSLLPNPEASFEVENFAGDEELTKIRAASGAKLETAIATVMSSDSFTKT